MGAVGEIQLRRDLLHRPVGIGQQLAGVVHAEFHSVIKQAQPGMAHHHRIEIVSAVIQRLFQRRAGHAAVGILQQVGDVQKNQVLGVAAQRHPGAVIQRAIPQIPEQPQHQPMQDGSGAGLRFHQLALHGGKQLADFLDGVLVAECRKQVQIGFGFVIAQLVRQKSNDRIVPHGLFLGEPCVLHRLLELLHQLH